MAPLDAADIRSDDPTAFVRETGEVKALAASEAAAAEGLADLTGKLEAIERSLEAVALGAQADPVEG